MQFFNRKSNDEKLRDELPWLWALDDMWSPRARITMNDLTASWETWLGNPWRKGGEWWAKAQFGVLHCVRKLELVGDQQRLSSEAFPPPFSIAKAALEAFPLGDDIEYVVLKTLYEVSDGKFYEYVVFRAPRRGVENLRKIFERLTMAV